MHTPHALAAYPVITSVQVPWGDMDALGHVNNVAYFRYLETARIAYFESLDVPGGLLRSEVGPILRDTSCRFRRPVTYPDKLLVGATVSELRHDRFTMDYLAWSTAQDAIVATGSAELVGYDYAALRKAPWPDAVRDAVQARQQEAGQPAECS